MAPTATPRRIARRNLSAGGSARCRTCREPSGCRGHATRNAFVLRHHPWSESRSEDLSRPVGVTSTPTPKPTRFGFVAAANSAETRRRDAGIPVAIWAVMLLSPKSEGSAPQSPERESHQAKSPNRGIVSGATRAEDQPGRAGSDTAECCDSPATPRRGIAGLPCLTGQRRADWAAEARSPLRTAATASRSARGTSVSPPRVISIFRCLSQQPTPNTRQIR
jgi:hypothetical protein